MGTDEQRFIASRGPFGESYDPGDLWRPSCRHTEADHIGPGNTFYAHKKIKKTLL
jgi:hypothetical protein